MPKVVLDSKSLLTESLVCALEAFDATIDFDHDSTVIERLGDPAFPSPDLVVVCPRYKDDSLAEIATRIAALKVRRPDVNFAVLSHIEEVESILKVLSLGARGYIPTTLPLRVVVQALRLIIAGGIFVPSTSLLALSSGQGFAAPKAGVPEGLLNAREYLVAMALRKGTPNKTIAGELGLAESTVKLLVRSVMRKLKAKNRTEVAYLTNSMFINSELDGSSRCGQPPTL